MVDVANLTGRQVFFAATCGHVHVYMSDLQLRTATTVANCCYRSDVAPTVSDRFNIFCIGLYTHTAPWPSIWMCWWHGFVLSTRPKLLGSL